jgi:uncharacterized protein YggU (UPF0235/DUF167 family)
MTGAFRPRDGGIDLFVRLTPKSSADAVDGIAASADGRAHIAARVRAVPEKGAANAALERLIAGHFGIPRSRVAVVAGQTGRLKTVRVDADIAVLRARLDSLPAVG